MPTHKRKLSSRPPQSVPAAADASGVTAWAAGVLGPAPSRPEGHPGPCRQAAPFLHFRIPRPHDDPHRPPNRIASARLPVELSRLCQKSLNLPPASAAWEKIVWVCRISWRWSPRLSTTQQQRCVTAGTAGYDAFHQHLRATSGSVGLHAVPHSAAGNSRRE